MTEQPREICRWFRQKAMYLSGAEVDPDRFAPGSFAHCWCLHTNQPCGPDDQRVDPDECVKGRKCWEGW